MFVVVPSCLFKQINKLFSSCNDGDSGVDQLDGRRPLCPIHCEETNLNHIS